MVDSQRSLQTSKYQIMPKNSQTTTFNGHRVGRLDLEKHPIDIGAVDLHPLRLSTYRWPRGRTMRASARHTRTASIRKPLWEQGLSLRNSESASHLHDVFDVVKRYKVSACDANSGCYLRKPYVSAFCLTSNIVFLVSSSAVGLTGTLTSPTRTACMNGIQRTTSAT